jgi:hypothetical protein
MGTRKDPPTGTENGVVARNVPGWQISYPLFDRLISLYAFYTQQSPVFMGATRSPGFEYCLTKRQNLECRPCTTTQQLSASLLFQNSSGETSLVDSIWRAPIEAEEQIILMRKLPAAFNRRLHLNSPPEIPINALWWELANTEQKSELATTCGCCNHSHSRCTAS